MRLCRHCQKRGANRPRGFCAECWFNPAIVALYPLKPLQVPRREPTAEELEQTIREQLQRLPAWWHQEAEEVEDEAVEIRLFRVRGRGDLLTVEDISRGRAS